MKFLNSAVCVVLMSLASFACDKDDDKNTDTPQPDLEVKAAKDIPANLEEGGTPKFTYYSLRTGEIVNESAANSKQWDLAFSGTKILVNGGASGPGEGAALILEGELFDEVEEAPAEGYTQDGEEVLAIPAGSGNGWYKYTGGEPPIHAILPIVGRVIVLKTGDGKYAKVEIISYYKGNPDTSTEEFADPEKREGRYYTFNYVLQTDGSRNF
ncbi:HmuY family protein [Rapidithrix thailandica]|uniref:HmuY family protein n=1 Tax=Rapidithrix thailandica TaxID=413964 RepID=A0AAW9S1C1_9BACT